MQRILLLITLFSAVCFKSAFSQSLTGVTGMLNAPSANMLRDGTFYLGANFLNKDFVYNYGNTKYNCLAYYFDITFLPFFEFNYRSTRQLNNPDQYHTVDRMFSIKLQVLKERVIRPSVALGINDVLTTASHGSPLFGATYIVTSKNIEWKKHLFGGTLGYAYPYMDNSQFNGVFAGVNFSPGFLRQVTVMLEYDSKAFNLGASVLFFKHLYVFGLLQGMKEFSGGIAYRVSAYSGFKKKNQEQ